MMLNIIGCKDNFQPGTKELSNELIIQTSNGSHKFTIEIADEPSEQNRGLMFRREMAKTHGMLFIHEDEQPRAMWMKNTYIPLDMLFIKSDGHIHHIVSNTEPFSEENIPSQGPVRAVLELVAGTVDRLNIKLGDRVKHTAFANEK